jgi:adenosylhomocysteine nucleosidase
MKCGMIAVTFAVPHESRDLRRLLQHASRVGEKGWLLGNFESAEVLIAHTGMGPAAAEASTRALLAELQPRWLLSAGYAGGLDSHLRHGAVLAAANFSSPELLAKWHGLRGTLTTQSRAIETVPERVALARATGAQAVDMETSAIVRVCDERHLPVLSVRAISDTAGERLPVPLEISFDLDRQRPRIAALLAFLVRNPGLILPFGRFVSGLAIARAALTHAIVKVLREGEAGV